MKKQHILFVLLLAFFAGISSANAQCTPDGFTPGAGGSYSYNISISGNGYSGAGIYTWYVTTNTDILTGIIPETNTFFTVDETGINSTYNDVTNTTNQINLTWTQAAVSSASTYYLVLRYTEANTGATPGCSGENIRVWQINPINTFMLAIEGATSAGAAFASAEQCSAPLISANVSPNANPLVATVNYTYGANTLYYRVTGSGILGSWRPSIRIPALAGLGQNYTSVQWNQNIDGSGPWHTFNVPALNTIGGDFVSTDDASITDAVAGTPILIRIIIANVNFETLTDQPILVGIDGNLPAAYTASDIWGPGTWPGTPDACSAATEFAKTATYTILARPTITKGSSMPTFIQKLP